MVLHIIGMCSKTISFQINIWWEEIVEDALIKNLNMQLKISFSFVVEWLILL